MTMAWAGGLLLAFVVALLIDMSESGFRTSDQVERELRTSCLAVVPLIKVEPKKPSPVHAEEFDHGSLRHIQGTGVLFGVIGNPFSRFAEAFRTIKVSIDLFSLAKATKAI